jgi:hypothetical protein
MADTADAGTLVWRMNVIPPVRRGRGRIEFRRDSGLHGGRRSQILDMRVLLTTYACRVEGEAP